MQPQFEIEETRNSDGGCMLVLRGELDMSVAGELEARLEELELEHVPVRLDLSRLTFIDSRGIRVVTLARLAGRGDGWTLEVGREVPSAVRMPLQLLGLDKILWSKTPD
jgi:anti-anti-sigma factor